MDIVLDIKNRLSLFKNFYDSVRIVDPIKNKVVLNKADDFKCNHGKFIENDEFLIVDCYNIWKRKTACENCISKKAFLKNDTFIKLEHNNGKIYLVIASPVEFEEKRYVVEILKDITNNGKVVDRSGDMTYLDLKMKNGKVAAFVLPHFVKKDDQLAFIKNEYNGVVIESSFADKQFFYGKGAGSLPHPL